MSVSYYNVNRVKTDHQPFVYSVKRNSQLILWADTNTGESITKSKVIAVKNRFFFTCFVLDRSMLALELVRVMQILAANLPNILMRVNKCAKPMNSISDRY